MRKAYDAWWSETRPMMINETVEMCPVRPYHEAYREQLASGGINQWKPATPDVSATQ
ncbi:hypothetical protein Pla100_46760 [Neorhodopirellula pilleata]|uniref:Uncharacterized protein n=1 Tax=Neorhodopirellula pilleata TaxID=2714738 RepID=A0A5C5ZZS2_9BACT|nr:hypothetical protein Pla100_46760 [Neorhodopirellula pilleata]